MVRQYPKVRKEGIVLPQHPPTCLTNSQLPHLLSLILELLQSTFLVRGINSRHVELDLSVYTRLTNCGEPYGEQAFLSAEASGEADRADR